LCPGANETCPCRHSTTLLEELVAQRRSRVRARGLTSSQLLTGEEESINMSYIPYILTFLLVLSPLYIPVGVTVVHAIETWRRRHLPELTPAAARNRRREMAAEFD
jgi:hypothetical protein